MGWVLFFCSLFLTSWSWPSVRDGGAMESLKHAICSQAVAVCVVMREWKAEEA
jgi:hypothetical protein